METYMYYILALWVAGGLALAICFIHDTFRPVTIMDLLTIPAVVALFPFLLMIEAFVHIEDRFHDIWPFNVEVVKLLKSPFVFLKRYFWTK